MNEIDKTWEALCDIHIDYHTMLREVTDVDEPVLFRYLDTDVALAEIKFTVQHLLDFEYLKERVFL